MKVGFLNNQIDNRGTGNALYDYAHYNEDILGNTSKIFTFGQGPANEGMVMKLNYRFGSIGVVDDIRTISGVDVLYHIKYGGPDGPLPSIPYAVHSVFSNSPHGDKYATISRWLSSGTTTPYVPHIVNLPNAKYVHFRKIWGIPETAIVFGRYGGRDTFDIPWVWDVIAKILEDYNNTWFLFGNTEPYLTHPRIVYHEDMITGIQKAAFIGASDYMLHARQRGETFGISVGEFASKGKPVITFGLSGERAHLDYLVEPFIYNDQFDLYRTLHRLSRIRGRKVVYSYTEFTPEKVMEKFEQVFLS